MSKKQKQIDELIQEIARLRERVEVLERGQRGYTFPEFLEEYFPNCIPTDPIELGPSDTSSSEIDWAPMNNQPTTSVGGNADNAMLSRYGRNP